jgi:hypothetical protein
MNINLHTIFRKIVNDDNFMTININRDASAIEEDINMERGYVMRQNTIEFIGLKPGEKHGFRKLPVFIHDFLLSSDIDQYNITRIGVHTFSGTVRTFIDSWNIIIRPELATVGENVFVGTSDEFMSFFRSSIIHNNQIDKIKNTRSIQKIHSRIVEDLVLGNINSTVIQKIVNIMETNLLIFDVSNQVMNFYWCAGTIYPFLNLFKKIYCMIKIGDHYEPILYDPSFYPIIYTKILLNEDIITQTPIRINTSSLLYFNEWKIAPLDYIAIYTKYFSINEISLG